MNAPARTDLKILILEDVVVDADLIERALRDSGLSFTSQRVDRRQAFENALRADAPDIVLLDCGLPGLNGLEALEIVRRLRPRVPVIEVAGALGEEAAVELLRAGARDYVLKDRLARLPGVVRRVLREDEEARTRVVAEASLRLSEEHYRNIVETSRDWIWEADAAGNLTYSSPSLRGMLGYEPSEVLGRSHTLLMSQVEAERLAPNFQALIRSGEPIDEIESLMRAKDGREVWVETSATRILKADGAYGGVRGVARDITKRKRVEKEIREEELRFHALVEQEVAGIFVIGATGRITYINPKFAVALGYGPNELIGLSMFDQLTQSERPGALSYLKQQLNGAASTAKITTYFKRKDGGRMDVLIQTARAEIDGQVAIMGVAVDITEQKRAEEALRASEEEFRLLIEWAPEAIILYDIITKRWVTANRNAEVLFQCGRAELLEVGPEPSFFDDPSADGPFPERLSAAARGEEVVFERRVRGGKGRDAFCEVRLIQIPAAKGPMVRASFLDITERKLAEATRAMQAAVISAVQESSLDGILVVGDDRKILAHNRRLAELLDIPVEALEGGDDEGLVRNTWRIVADPDAVLKRVAELNAQPDATSSEELVLKDGRVLDRFSAPVRLADGKHVGRVWYFRDITDRRVAEQKLREDEARFRALVELEVAGIYIVGPTGVVKYINPRFAKIFGYRPKDIIGRLFADFVAEADRAPMASRLQAELAGVPQKPIYASLKRKDGGLVEVQAHSGLATFDGQPASIGVILDVTEQRRSEQEMRRLNRTLVTLSAGNEILVRATSEKDLLSAMCAVLVERGGYRMAWVGTPEHDAARTIRPVVMAGDDDGYLKAVTITWAENDPLGRGVTGEATRTGHAQMSQNLATDPSMAPWLAEARRHGFAASAAFPLKDKEKVFATLSLYSSEIDAFNEQEMKLLQELADDAAYGILALRAGAEREAAVQRWRTSLEATIGVLASATEMRDPYTAGHQNRVAQLAVAIARDLKLPEEQVRGVSLAGLIHDVGKIVVPFEILTKPGKLTSLELQLIETHAQVGHDVVKDVAFPWPIAQAILQHHERLDGSGYPNHLQGDQILLEAKILAVADVVDAMTSHRPYRAALGIDVALAEIEGAKGRLYDPAVVESCVKLFREQGFKFT